MAIKIKLSLLIYVIILKKTRPIDKVIKNDYSIKPRKACSIAFRKRGTSMINNLKFILIYLMRSLRY